MFDFFEEVALDPLQLLQAVVVHDLADVGRTADSSELDPVWLGKQVSWLHLGPEDTEVLVADFLPVLSLHLVPLYDCLAHLVHFAALVIELKVTVNCCLISVFLDLLFELLHVLLLLCSHFLDLSCSEGCHSLVQLNSSLHCNQLL